MSNEYDEPPAYGFELPLLLFGGFRSIIDELHAEQEQRQLEPVRGQLIVFV